MLGQWKGLWICRPADIAKWPCLSVLSDQADIFSVQIFPKHRSSRTVGPGVEMREDPVERRKRRGDTDPDLMDATSLE